MHLPLTPSLTSESSFCLACTYLLPPSYTSESFSCLVCTYQSPSLPNSLHRPSSFKLRPYPLLITFILPLSVISTQVTSSASPSASARSQYIDSEAITKPSNFPTKTDQICQVITTVSPHHHPPIQSIKDKDQLSYAHRCV